MYFGSHGFNLHSPNFCPTFATPWKRDFLFRAVEILRQTHRVRREGHRNSFGAEVVAAEEVKPEEIQVTVAA